MNGRSGATVGLIAGLGAAAGGAIILGPAGALLVIGAGVCAGLGVLGKSIFS